MTPWQWVEPNGDGSGSRSLLRSSARSRQPSLSTFDLFELAWHDGYGEVTPSVEVVEDVLILSGGTIEGLVQAALLAVTDRRDLRVAADTRLARS